MGSGFSDPMFPIAEELFPCQAAAHIIAFQWKVELQRQHGDEAVGIQLDLPDLVVTRVSAFGLAAAWNTANMEKAILERDQILEVNGLSDPELIVQEMQQAESLEIWVGRTQQAMATMPVCGQGVCGMRKSTSRRFPKQVRSMDTSPRGSKASIFPAEKSHGPPPMVLQLPQDVSLRILWAISGGKASLGAHRDLCALSIACTELWESLKEDEHPLWSRKLNALLRTGHQGSSSSSVLGSSSVSPRKWCTWLLAARRLLRCALTYCDWVSLFDMGEILMAAQLRRPLALASAVRALVSWQEPPTPQALMWLWELAAGSEYPWYSRREPTPEAVRLDGLRDWLHKNVTSAIVPWREHAGSGDSFWDALFDEEQDELGAKISSIAALVLFAVECVWPPTSYNPDACRSGFISLRDVTNGVERALRQEHGVYHWRSVTVPLLLMLLARAHWTLEASPEGRKVLQRRRSEDETEGVAMDGARGAWSGVAIAWHIGVNTLDVKNVEVISFPDLFSDERWLHTQHGTLHFPHLDSWNTRTVQLDAKFDSQDDCFKGTWLDHESFRPLPAQVFTIQAQHGGFRSWMHSTVASVPSFADRSEPLQANAGHPEGDSKEFFGIIGRPADGALRCFHLMPPFSRYEGAAPEPFSSR